MTGYIDTNAEDPISVTVSGINTELSYDVIVYIKGGVNDKGGITVLETRLSLTPTRWHLMVTSSTANLVTT